MADEAETGGESGAEPPGLDLWHMTQPLVIIIVLLTKLASEMAGRWGENYYLTAKPFRAAALTTLVAGLSIPIGRMVITDRNNWAAGAVLLAVFVSTAWGSRDLARRTR